MSAADFSLYYTNEDDGIWISHGAPFGGKEGECVWEHHVGIGLHPTVEEVNQAVAEHLRASHPELAAQADGLGHQECVDPFCHRMAPHKAHENADRIKETLTRDGIYRSPRPDVEVESPADIPRTRLVPLHTIRDVAELVAGLAVPVSLGMGSDGLLGTAFEPWKRLYDRYGTAWASADEIEQRLREDFEL